MTSTKPVAGLRLLASIGTLLILIFQGCTLFGSNSSDDDSPPTVFRGYFTISAPASGARLNMDSSYAILWSPSDSVVNGNVRISVYEGERFLANIATSAANSGMYNWRPSLSSAASGYKLGSGMSLRIRIASALDTSKWDFGPYFNTYSNYTGSLDLSSPASGAQVRMDSSYAIRWTTTGSVGTYVGIQLLKDTIPVATLTVSALISGYYLWSNIAPYLTIYGSGNDYHIRVFSVVDPSIDDVSPAFSIISSYSGGFNITSPAAGDSLTAGASHTITWTTTGNPGSEVAVSLVRDSTPVVNISSYIGTETGSALWTPNAGIASSNRYRIKITSLDDAGIFAYSAYFTVKGSEPDAYERDDSLKLAKAIPVTGEAQQHTMTYLDQDWLKFNTVKGKRYIISVRSTASSVYAYVYDSTGASAGVPSQSGTNIQSVLTPAYAGKYLVRITPLSGYGAYTIAVTEYDSTQSSFAVDFSAPDEKTTWAAGSLYTISYAPDSAFYGSYVNLTLFMDSTQVQSITTYTANSGSYSWSLPAGLSTSSRYRIRIASYGNTQIYAFSPYFTISGVQADAFEPDNVKSSANVLPDDGVAQAHNFTSGDVDWIRINAVAGRRYLISINSPLYSVYGYLQDSLGTSILSQSGTQFQLALTPTYTGAYYVRMVPSSSYGSYSIAMVSYDSTQNGFPVKFTSPDSASTWASGSVYPLNWTADQSIYGATVSMALYLDSAFVQNIATGITNSGTYSWSIPTGLVTSGRYRIRVTNYYSAGVYGYGPYFTISGLTPDSYEPDNVRGASKDIATDGVAQQHNITASDSDWVKFNAVTGKSYLVSVSSLATVYLYIYDSVGTQVAYTSGSKPSLVLNPTRAGRYHVRVQYNFSTGPYTLAVLGFDAGQGGIPAKFKTPNDSTVWAAGSAYLATWTPDSTVYGTYVSLALYHDSTLIQSLVSSAVNSGSYSVTMPLGLATSNRYRIRMTSGNSTQIFGYSPFFTVSGTPPDTLEPNDSAASARSVAPNAGKQALSLTNRDRDWFKFTAKAQMLYLIQATSTSALPTTMRLYSGLGTSLITTNSKTGSLDSVNSIAWVSPSDGQYSVSLDPSSVSYYGPYGFEIKEIDPASYKFTVSTPAADTVVHLSEAVVITWNDPSKVKGYVDIFLYDASGVVQTIAANYANGGTYTWTVPLTATAKEGYYIKVISRMSASINGSSPTFSIAP
jgi:hypothetical protein